jgi:hypothetical protein
MQRVITAGIIGIIVLSLAAAVVTSRSSAQEGETPTPAPTNTPVPTPTAYPLSALKLTLLGLTNVEAVTDGPARVSAATLAIAPGQVSVPFIAEGTTILVVSAGQITIESDGAEIRLVDTAVLVGLSSSEATPGAVDGEVVKPGYQVVLQPGSTTTLRNESEAAATIMLLSVFPLETDAEVTPVP